MTRPWISELTSQQRQKRLEKIHQLAYDKWERSYWAAGMDLRFWLEAEVEYDWELFRAWQG